MASSNHSFCIDLPIYKNKKTFCGITKVWKPRYGNYTALIACVIVIISACLLTLYNIYQVMEALLTKNKVVKNKGV